MSVSEHFPLTTRYLGKLPASASEAASVDAFVEAVCAEFAKGDIPCRAARDLARYEALLRELPGARPPPGPLPRDEEECVLAPHARLLVFGADLPGMVKALREGKLASPRPARGWVLFTPAEETFLWREEGWFLESFREATPPGDVIEDDEDRALFAKLWSLGALVRSD